jgi:choline dehydrogenase-like flavoprotein
MLLARSLAPAMLIGLGYFDGALSDNRIVVDAGADGLRVHIDGGWARSFSDALAETRSKLRRVFLRLGGILLPGSLNALPPGGDSHYAGTLAMGDLLTRDCEVAARPGVYVVDGAAFNRLPAKHCTLTLMANADRVGGRIAVSAFAAGRASPVHRP